MRFVLRIRFGNLARGNLAGMHIEADMDPNLFRLGRT